MKEVYNKLSQIQVELNAPKNQYNSFGKYKYRNCEDICNAIKPYLKKLKCALQLFDEIVMVGERYYVKATAKLIDFETGETVENTAYAREEENKKGMDSSQVTGASSSYARKYALNGLFAIDDVKDSDSTCTHGKEHKSGMEFTSVDNVCANCHSEIKGYTASNNKYVAPDTIISKSNKEFGKPLCIDCYKELKKNV